MQIKSVDMFPVWTQVLPPLGRKVLRLRHDVLDGVPLHRNGLLATRVFQLAQEVVAGTKIVHIFDEQLSAELVVVRETTVGVLKQQRCFQNFSTNAVGLTCLYSAANVLFSELVGMSQMARRNT